MKYRRVYSKGGTYFFTLVTFNRLPILKGQTSIDLLEDALQYTAERMPFDLVANVVLPDHMHFIWTLPEGSDDFSTRWRLIKSHFSRSWKKNGCISQVESRRKKGEQDVWQRRFWEHLIRDEIDLVRHIEYVHYNPVKHGLVNSVVEWQYSSFHNYVAQGLFPQNWGEGVKIWVGERFME
jgi:REP-associated tyrosine transposase